jgi:aarF domain-containing kinase
MAFAAATLDFGVLLDAFKAVGLKMKRENVAEDMEGMRFFLRDIVPSQKARKRIKAKIKTDRDRMAMRKKGEKVPMESKAYPGEFFFFVRVNELLHGLGSRMSIEMAYLDVLKPYAEQGLRRAIAEREVSTVTSIPPSVESMDLKLVAKLENVIKDLQKESKIEGMQICVIDMKGDYLANVTSGTLGGLKNHIPMQSDALILGYSCTKAVAATMAHVMVSEGYLHYDEPVCERVWMSFCPTKEPPKVLAPALGLSDEVVRERWAWKRQITLRNILAHQAGLWATMPHRMTIKSLASCELCVAAYEYDSSNPEATLLPTIKPGKESEYHFMSFGWLIAGTLCGAHQQKHGVTITFEELYNKILKPKLSSKTLSLGFRPCGGSGGHLLAQVVTSDIRASSIVQQRRESEAMGEVSEHSAALRGELFDSFQGKEFLLDSRIWNCEDAVHANVPSAGGRFSAMGLAHFYHDLGSGKILDKHTIEKVSQPMATETVVKALQGASLMAHDGEENRTSLGLGYQLIRFDKDAGGIPSAFGHAGVGGSIGLFHKKSGLAIAMMTNKADGGREVTMRISRVIMSHFNL